MHILLFRPPADAERSAGELVARGHEPIIAPLFDVDLTGETAPEGDFAALVLASGNGVQALTDASPAWRNLPLFAVGDRTAAKARDVGFTDVRSASGDRNDLIEAIKRSIAAPARLLLVLGRDRHDDVAERLTAAGYDVTVWTAYAAQAKSTLPDIAATALREGRADAALHYSQRGAETFLNLAQSADLTAPALRLPQIVLSEQVAAPLRAAGAETILVADHPDETALLATLDQLASRQPGGDSATEPAPAPAGGDTRRDAMSEPQTMSPRGRHKRVVQKAEQTTPEAAVAASQEPASATVDDAMPATTEPAAVEAPAEAPAETTADHAVPPPLAQQTPPPPRPARLPWAALALSGLIGGGIGAAGMSLLAPAAPTGATPAQMAEVSRAIEAKLQTALANLPQRQELATLDGKLGQLSQAAAAAATEAKAATSRLAELAKTPSPSAPTGNDSAVAALTERLGTLESQAKKPAEPTPQGSAAARMLLAGRVQDALAGGRPFAAELAALTRAGTSAESLEGLSAAAGTGLPTQAALLAQLRAHRSVFDRETAPAAKDWQGTLFNLASRIVTVRPAGDTGANDPATLPIRLEAALTRGDFAAASGLWNQLPEPARRESADFGKNLQNRANAQAAITRIAQDAVAALGAGD